MWSSDEIVKATAGSLKGKAFDASAVAIDSRKLKAGALFVALKGDRVDGHDYVAQAFAAGAGAALVHRMPAGISDNASLIVVEDSYKALIALAEQARKRTSAKILAVTGSVGKTGTKEALRVALASSGKTYGAEGNLNNHIGLPLSLANLPKDARFGVFELGMNHTGELTFLTRIARPDAAIITNVEAVHLEFFAGVEAIADAKAEIMEGIPKAGTIVLNRDNVFYDRLRDHAKKQGIKNIITFGAHADADCRLVHYEARDMGSQVEAMIAGTAITYRLATIGRHYAIGSLGVLALAISAGADLADAAAALAHFNEPDGRGRVHSVALTQGNIALIDDCYNASPSSMEAGFSKLSELQKVMGKGRKIAVLGDMLELGKASAELHKGLLAGLEKNSVDKIYVAGPMMKQLYDILPPAMRGASAANAKELASLLSAALQPGDVVLLKGSRGSRMDIIRDMLTHKESH